MTTRLSVNINDETARTLRDMAATDETTVTDIVRRAVSVYKVVSEGSRRGKTIQMVSADEIVTIELV